LIIRNYFIENKSLLSCYISIFALNLPSEKLKADVAQLARAADL
tara:strand:- start:24832 stop:24963 length:132 start_codon:yes stop_codon:yes gene_type:complete